MYKLTLPTKHRQERYAKLAGMQCLSQPQVCVQNNYIQRVAKFQSVQINFRGQTQSVRDKDTHREGGGVRRARA